jgi:hypothetical protein
MNPTIVLSWPEPPRDGADRAARVRVHTFADHWAGLPRPNGAKAPNLESYLDRADPTVQPDVAIVDVDGRRMPIRLYATNREATFGGNLTGIDALNLYPDGIRARIWSGALGVVMQPCGWLTERVMTSARGRSVNLWSLSLPLASGGTVKHLVNFTAIMGPVPEEGVPAQVNAVSRGAWVDVGFGVPAELPN